MTSAPFDRPASARGVAASWAICLALALALFAADRPGRNRPDPARPAPLAQEQARAPLQFPPALPG